MVIYLCTFLNDALYLTLQFVIIYGPYFGLASLFYILVINIYDTRGYIHSTHIQLLYFYNLEIFVRNCKSKHQLSTTRRRSKINPVVKFYYDFEKLLEMPCLIICRQSYLSILF